MTTDTPLTHIFWQEDPDSQLFTYGRGKYTEAEVNSIVKLLPKSDKVIRIVWVEPEDYPKFNRDEWRESVNNIEENLNLDEN